MGLCWQYGRRHKKPKDGEEQEGKRVCCGTDRTFREGKAEPVPKQADVSSLQRPDLTFDHIRLIQWSGVKTLASDYAKKLCDASVWFKIFQVPRWSVQIGKPPCFSSELRRSLDRRSENTHQT